jgi:hypothetical protein
MNEPHWLDQTPQAKPKRKPKRPVAGQRPLFDECTPEFAVLGGKRFTQGVLFRPPESAGEPPPIKPIGANEHADSDRDSPPTD